MEEEYRSAYTRRTWRSCCLAPAIAVAVIFLLTVVAGLFGPEPRKGTSPAERPAADGKSSLERRQAFVRFGKQYFAIARKTDDLNEKAFVELERLGRGQGSPAKVKAAFRGAADANRLAAAQYKTLAVPAVLLAQEKCQDAMNTMSDAFEARRRACEIVVRWTDDTESQTLAGQYARHADEVNRLTAAGLAALGAAAEANGVTEDDVRRFLPASGGRRATQFGDVLMPNTLNREAEENR